MDFTISLKTFEKHYKSEKDSRAKQRLHILLLRRQKYTQQEIAKIVRCSQGTVSNVVRRFRKESWNSVYDKPRDGRPTKLTNDKKRILKEKMTNEFVEGEIRRGWQTKDVRAVMKKQFKIVYTPQHTRRILHSIGMSWKVPRPEHKNRDEKAVRAFKKTSPGRYCLWQMSTKLFA